MCGGSHEGTTYLPPHAGGHRSQSETDPTLSRIVRVGARLSAPSTGPSQTSQAPCPTSSSPAASTSDGMPTHTPQGHRIVHRPKGTNGPHPDGRVGRR